MSAGHTPGPWRVEDDTNLVWGECDPDDQTTFGMGYPVAECCSPRSWSKQHVPTWEHRVANAHLIAAAPDLLSLVRRFIALPSGAWHPERHAAEELELEQDARRIVATLDGDQS